MGRRLLVGIVGTVAALLGGAGALGGQATTTVTCGMSVTTSIKLANDLANCPGNGLVVDADKVTIDLNGHTLDGTGSSAGILAAGHSGVTVLRGTLTDFVSGITFSNGSKEHVLGVTASDTAGDGFEAGSVDGLLIEKSYAVDNGAFGFDVAGSGAVLKQVASVSSGFSGIQLVGDHGTVTRSLVSDPIAAGIRASGAALRISGNHVLSPGADGIDFPSASDGEVSGNTIGDVGGDGIQVRGPDFEIASNTVLRAAFRGIDAFGGSGDTIAGNTVESSGGDGIFVGGEHHHIAGNLVRVNTDTGLHDASTASTVRANVAIANDDGIVTTGIDGGGNRAAANLSSQCSGVVCALP